MMSTPSSPIRKATLSRALPGRPSSTILEPWLGRIAAEEGTENICRIGGSLSVYTHFSVFYPHIRQFIDSDSPLTPGQPATSAWNRLTPRRFS